MIDKENAIAQTIAQLDSIILSCREQQISLAKLLAKEFGWDEKNTLAALKETSINLLKKNGLEY